MDVLEKREEQVSVNSVRRDRGKEGEGGEVETMYCSKNGEFLRQLTRTKLILTSLIEGSCSKYRSKSMIVCSRKHKNILNGNVSFVLEFCLSSLYLT